jgi:enoyl-CoA hydratase/carnithine racemase
MMSQNWILTEHKGLVFEIILNRPDKRNAIQVQMLTDLATAVAKAEKTQGVRLITIRGAGKAFSSGLDLTAMGGNVEQFGEDWANRPHELTRYWQACLNRLTDSPLPTLALLHGYCIGAGTEIALACDLRYADPETTLSLEETKNGLIPDVGGSTRLTQLIGPARAKEMIFTSRRIDPATAEKWGLINRIVPIDEFDQAAQTLAEEISGCAPLAVAAAKRVIQGVLSEEDGLRLEMMEQAPLFHTKDLQIGVQAAMLKQKPEWTWE